MKVSQSASQSARCRCGCSSGCSCGCSCCAASHRCPLRPCECSQESRKSWGVRVSVGKKFAEKEVQAERAAAAEKEAADAFLLSASASKSALEAVFVGSDEGSSSLGPPLFGKTSRGLLPCASVSGLLCLVRPHVAFCPVRAYLMFAFVCAPSCQVSSWVPFTRQVSVTPLRLRVSRMGPEVPRVFVAELAPFLVQMLLRHLRRLSVNLT